MPFQTKDAYVLGQELCFLTGANRGNRVFLSVSVRSVSSR
jgi:hypothetical protein